jgi:predicted DNA-binding transcriptional regulator YafY
MGMTIDDAIKYYSNKNVVLTEEEAEANTIALNTMRKYQQLQADYENRLKADLKAILVELQLEIEELDTPNNGSAYMDCVEIIQQKIDAMEDN